MKKDNIDKIKDRLYMAFNSLPSAEREQSLLDNADELTDDDIIAIYNDRELGESNSHDYYDEY